MPSQRPFKQRYGPYHSLHLLIEKTSSILPKMPPTRRKSGNPSTRAQQTLAFGPNSNKVTKPSLPPQSKKLSKPAQEEISKTITTPTTEVSTPEPEIEHKIEDTPQQQQPEPQIQSPRTLAIRKQGAAPQATAGSEIEQKAAKISDTQVRKYWAGKENERIAPRVHQEGLSVHEKVLRHFDLSSQFGVCCPKAPLFETMEEKDFC